MQNQLRLYFNQLDNANKEEIKNLHTSNVDALDGNIMAGEFQNLTGKKLALGQL